jgi:ubiquinone/menaquinone biosynthesis C-methylase UbiE
MNYFSPKSAAERYAKGRPDFHRNTIEHIKSYLGLESKLEKALDIACGTGLSTKALLDIAEQVYGTDNAAEMLKWVPIAPNIHYYQATAEEQPLDNETFNLITVSSGVHWFNIDQFLKEAQRLLKPGAWLVLYENHFIAEIPGKENFKHWFKEIYLKKFPSLPGTMIIHGITNIYSHYNLEYQGGNI